MKTYIGIDLGTTNSAICSYNGSETRIWKSPEQNDITPSAIYFEKRGNKYYGSRAYNNAPYSPDNVAMLFKRLMGTSTPIHIRSLGISKSPEECSAEILKVLFGYLPEEIRNKPDTGTVITVPAAFNQMQKDATMQAADMAGIGKVALMQEPVAAVMSVMRTRTTDGSFLIYDLGGGTLDIAIAESIGGRVSLLAHGGIAVCGGREFDRILVDNIVRPWLMRNYALPEDLSANPAYKSLLRLSAWATEKAKIGLSVEEESVISLSESEVRMRDLNGCEIYLDIPISREIVDDLIAERVNETIEAARQILTKAGLSPHDLERIVFVGGPTHYKPLRDKVSFELGIPASTELNPMTAVAEGASLFAESIDWDTQNRSRKTNRGQIVSGGTLSLTFDYISRTPDIKTKIAINLAGKVQPNTEFQIDSLDTGWSSGRFPLEQGVFVDINLPRLGENTFKVFVFDPNGGPVALEQDIITVARTAATVDAIPASHSIGIEVLDRLGGRPILDYIGRTGDQLPHKGHKVFKAAESLKAGSSGTINFKIWEGEIEDPITDNRPVGTLKISGNDFDSGVIPAGADLECDYEILDSGNIILEVSVPSIGGLFHSGKNFYSRQEGQMDYTDAAALVCEEGNRTCARIDEINKNVDDSRLNQARQKLEPAISLRPDETEIENTQEAMEKVLDARRLLAQVRQEHLPSIRQIELDNVTAFFNDHLRQYAKPSESTSFDNLMRTAQRAIDRNDKEFESLITELRKKNFFVLWRQDWFVIERFKYFSAASYLFVDKKRFSELVETGTQCLRMDDINKLREVVGEFFAIKIADQDSGMFELVNIVRG